MKKTYIKPEIFFDSFSLSTNIATNCEVTFDLASRGSCGIPDDNDTGMNIFDLGTGGTCTAPGKGSETYDGLCYHVPTENNNLFNS